MRSCQQGCCKCKDPRTWNPAKRDCSKPVAATATGGSSAQSTGGCNKWSRPCPNGNECITYANTTCSNGCCVCKDSRMWNGKDCTGMSSTIAAGGTSASSPAAAACASKGGILATDGVCYTYGYCTALKLKPVYGAGGKVVACSAYGAVSAKMISDAACEKACVRSRKCKAGTSSWNTGLCCDHPWSGTGGCTNPDGTALGTRPSGPATAGASTSNGGSTTTASCPANQKRNNAGQCVPECTYGQDYDTKTGKCVASKAPTDPYKLGLRTTVGAPGTVSLAESLASSDPNVVAAAKYAQYRVALYCSHGGTYTKAIKEAPIQVQQFKWDELAAVCAKAIQDQHAKVAKAAETKTIPLCDYCSDRDMQLGFYCKNPDGTKCCTAPNGAGQCKKADAATTTTTTTTTTTAAAGSSAPAGAVASRPWNSTNCAAAGCTWNGSNCYPSPGKKWDGTTNTCVDGHGWDRYACAGAGCAWDGTSCARGPGLVYSQALAKCVTQPQYVAAAAAATAAGGSSAMGSTVANASACVGAGCTWNGTTCAPGVGKGYSPTLGKCLTPTQYTDARKKGTIQTILHGNVAAIQADLYAFDGVATAAGGSSAGSSVPGWIKGCNYTGTKQAADGKWYCPSTNSYFTGVASTDTRPYKGIQARSFGCFDTWGCANQVVADLNLDSKKFPVQLLPPTGSGTTTGTKMTPGKYWCTINGTPVTSIDTTKYPGTDATWACNTWRPKQCAGVCTAAPMGLVDQCPAGQTMVNGKCVVGSSVPGWIKGCNYTGTKQAADGKWYCPSTNSYFTGVASTDTRPYKGIQARSFGCFDTWGCANQVVADLNLDSKKFPVQLLPPTGSGTTTGTKMTPGKYWCTINGTPVTSIDTTKYPGTDATWACNTWRPKQCAGVCTAAPMGLVDQCPAGQTMVNGKCVVGSASCSTTNSCILGQYACKNPSGQSVALVDTTDCGKNTDPTWACNAWRTQCANKCTASFVAANKPTCPSGQTYVPKCGGGSCKSTSCPSDKPYVAYTSSGSTCVATCPANQVASLGVCTPCPTGQTVVNNVCTAAPAPAPADSTSSQPAVVAQTIYCYIGYGTTYPIQYAQGAPGNNLGNNDTPENACAQWVSQCGNASMPCKALTQDQQNTLSAQRDNCGKDSRGLFLLDDALTTNNSAYILDGSNNIPTDLANQGKCAKYTNYGCHKGGAVHVGDNQSWYYTPNDGCNVSLYNSDGTNYSVNGTSPTYNSGPMGCGEWSSEKCPK